MRIKGIIRFNDQTEDTLGSRSEISSHIKKHLYNSTKLNQTHSETLKNEEKKTLQKH